MAKQRNSLGICVLPAINSERLSWEEYKERTGVDLEKIFYAINNSGDPDNPEYTVLFKTSFSKLIVVNFVSEYSELAIPRLSFPNKIDQVSTADKTTSRVILGVQYGDGDGGFNLVVYADKTIMGAEI